MTTELQLFHVIEDRCVHHYIAAFDGPGALALLVEHQGPFESDEQTVTLMTHEQAVEMSVREDGSDDDQPKKSLATYLEEQAGKPGYIAGSEW